MQDGDGGSAIFANFQPAFTGEIYKVKKKTTEGNGTPTVPVWQNVAESDNIFWLASRSEISGASIDVRYKSEGSQYAYYANKSIGDDTTSANACLAKLTRAGKEPTVDSSKTQATGCWWMRSPNVEAGASYLAVSSTGCLNTAGLNAGTTYAGVVPCFCF